MTPSQPAAVTARPGALSQQQMLGQLITFPAYRTPPEAPARRFEAEVRRLWGGRLTPMMASADTSGRYALAPLACPATACTGALELAAGAHSEPWRNPDAIECLVCVEGSVEVRYGPELDRAITLGRFDMLSLPEGVRHQLRNAGAGVARVVSVLSIAPAARYDAVFDQALAAQVPAEAQSALGLRFDAERGAAIDTAVIEGRVTRFEKLVPYKKDLNRTGGLPAEATESLSAGNVYPLIVPEGHVGRSRTAPMYGNQGLYISIAECKTGDDGPPPHAHTDTQESFFVLDGAFDMCTGFDNESGVKTQAGDLIAMPSNVMRSFRNTTDQPARLLVIIQGPDRMNDTVFFSRRVGEGLARRFGENAIAEYAKIKMTFDAEQRLGV
ncbi:cupin domain-containing protein [Ottowia pentelensis]|uniref:Cupin domain-containing protein n=1 Tax=Ottowia pentelensis TaxID=511108 RepID=A0ABV6PWQ5_9BURK|nr:cupin domain-containing protein [Ottowia sp.]